LSIVEEVDARGSRVAGDLLDPEVPIGNARDLRQMRDRHDLGPLGESAQRVADPVRRLAADAGVDLVEDHRLTTRHGGDRESDARELAAGGGLRNRTERQTRVRPYEERNLVETGLARISLPQLGDELALTQAYSDELARHVLREASSRLAPRSAE